ncbi:hypothetical protein KO528_08090 [Saccharophagus degradans]|uniref:Uncharacterized protein n=2 Tax=Saccharophagus degradans TaxID=86304 RepID=A0AAW7X216_9GAMM|nr:hypothetical protein [Saccharophagus degradans]MBU2985307.1 hypothetical protein [Saccharophagus degradans]MDO6421389.1 hypothetical protein [Saccharophagus degradans]MDO6609585.1 hypothetical protein [Saccharophagus degradans]
MKILKKGTISVIAIAAAFAASNALADYTTSFTTTSINPYDYDGAWGPGDCGWLMQGSGGSGGYGGGAGYRATKDCPYSYQSMSWSWSQTAQRYNVSIRQYGDRYCEHGTESVEETVIVEQCAAQ